MAEIILGKVRGYLGQNILHNWDFRNPVNQRGVSGTISTPGYFLDRWVLVEETVTVAGGYLTMPTAAEIEQRIEGNLLAGAVVTVSVMVGGEVYSGTGTFPTSAGTASVTLTGWGTATLGYAAGYMYVRLGLTGTSNVQAVKLELGTVSTLHLDPPMDHAVELPKCLRFLWISEPDIRAAYLNAYSSWGYNVPFPVPMKDVPTVNVTLRDTTIVTGSLRSTRYGATITSDSYGTLIAITASCEL